jgi:hypothetical protein
MLKSIDPQHRPHRLQRLGKEDFFRHDKLHKRSSADTDSTELGTPSPCSPTPTFTFSFTPATTATFLEGKNLGARNVDEAEEKAATLFGPPFHDPLNINRAKTDDVVVIVEGAEDDVEDETQNHDFLAVQKDEARAAIGEAFAYRFPGTYS